MRDTHPRRLGLSAGIPAFLLGFQAAAFQVYLLREFSAEFYGNELVFGLFLGSWLFWGGLGSLVPARRRAGAGTGRLARLYGLTIVVFFASLVVLRFSHKLLGVLPAELTGLVPALGFAFVLSLLLSFPLGVYFVINADLRGGDVPSVYILESAGAAAAGLVVHFLLIPWFSNWQGAAIVGAGAALLALVGMKSEGARAFPAAALVLAACLAGFDLPAQKEAWKPMDLIEVKDSPYGKLQVVRNKEQITLLDNGVAVFSHPDVGAAEEAVHFALLQRREMGRILLIGGAASGGAAEALKYPGLRIEGVELDPAMVGLVRKHLTGAASAVLDSPRVRIVPSDGRAYLARSAGRYDAILLALPEPATAQLNRYYTREFFLEVRKKLNPGGVFGFVVPSAENYISSALARFLSSLAATLRGVFSEVVAVPGANCVFLASESPLTIDPGRLSERLAELGFETSWVNAAILPFRLDPGRVRRLAEKLDAPEARVNRDLVPAGYYFHSLLWAGHFRGLESRILRAAGRLPSIWILDLPLALFALGLALLALRNRQNAARSLVPLAVMGFTSIVVELAVFIAFQAHFGFVYGKIPLLLAAFMSGLVAGSLLAWRRNRPSRTDLAAAQGAFVLLLVLTLASLSGAGGEIASFVLLSGFGALGGYLFVSASRLLGPGRSHPGLGYGVDLLASFAGVILASTLVIPLYGVPAIILRLIVLNALCFLFILVPSRG